MHTRISSSVMNLNQLTDVWNLRYHYLDDCLRLQMIHLNEEIEATLLTTRRLLIVDTLL